MKTVHVNASKEYDIHIGCGILDKSGSLIAEISKAKKIALVSETTVYPLYGQRVEEALRSAGFEVVSYVFPAGEQSKTLETFGKVVNFFADNRLSRGDLAVALGGGVTGDLTGFAASTYRRGISYVQIPTTVLSAVDSSVGGKTAVDLPAGKNLAGCFWQPSLVICDPDTLQTLPPEIYRDGCAEVLKYGLLGNAAFFEALSAKPADEWITEVIATCVSMKRDIVNMDEFDRGERAKLNLGHTFGHSVEALSNFSISHGSAVAIGTAMIYRAAAKYGYCTPEETETVISVLRKYGLPTEAPFPQDKIFSVCHSDKKVIGSSLDLIVPTGIGSCIIRKTPMSEIAEWIQAGY